MIFIQHILLLLHAKNNMKKKSNKKIKVAVFSSAYGDPKQEYIDMAQKIGKYLAEKKCTILTGGCIGLPAMVAAHAHAFGAETIAYYPNVSEKELLKNKKIHNNDIDGSYTEKKFYDGFTKRSIEMIHDADIALAFNGRLGTLSEITVAIEEGLPTGIIENSGGVSDEMRRLCILVNRGLESEQIIIDSNHINVIDELIHYCK